MKGLAKEHICMTHRHRQQCSDGYIVGKGWEWGAGWRQAKGRKMGVSLIVSTIKIKLREREKLLHFNLSVLLPSWQSLL